MLNALLSCDDAAGNQYERKGAKFLPLLLLARAPPRLPDYSIYPIPHPVWSRAHLFIISL